MRLRRGVAVLWRGPGTTQVGIARPLVFSGLEPRDQHALAALEGSGFTSVRRLSGPGRAAFAAIERAHLLETDAVGDGAIEPGTVAIHGTGPLGLELGLALARAGRELVLHDLARAASEPTGTYGGRPVGATCETAAADFIRAAVPNSRVRIGAEPGDLTVVISVAAADPASWVPLMAADLPHLLITSDEEGVDVGPLVLPGHSACGECLGLALTREDSAWPRVASQAWSGRRPHASPEVNAMAAGLAAAAIRAHLEGTGAWAVNARWRCASGSAPLSTAVMPDPDCGCGATDRGATDRGATDRGAARPRRA